MRDLPQPPKPTPSGNTPGKLVVVESVAHILPDRPPVAIESRYARWLDTDTRAVVDEWDAGSAWEPVQTGRLKGVGMLVIENLESTDLTAVPTPAQRQEIAARIVQFTFLPTPLLPGEDTPAAGRVLPGESARFQPEEGVSVYLRCKAAGRMAKVRTTAVPA